MCGITGIIDPSNRLDRLESTIDRMTDTMSLRGPDDRGVFTDPAAGVALGHRRLSVIGLAPSGRQPMQSRSGRTLLVFNGEIYNYLELRRALESEGVDFQTDTDTEVLLEACERWGVPRAVERLVGMFAFASFDTRERVIHLVRDRVGIKPLVFWSDGRSLVFGSDLRPLEACPLVPSEIDPAAVASLLRYSCITGTRSILSGVEKVPPGCMVSIRIGAAGLDPTPIRYWDPVALSQEAAAAPDDAPFEQQSERLEQLLTTSVRDRLVADVPLGCFLSGGIDSSLAVALAQKSSSSPIRTFTIGMDDRHLDEAPYARRIADHLGTDHTEHRVTPAEVLDLIPGMASVFDEPFADSSQIPTFLVSRLARREVTVSISGDGGDELFGGYTRYTLGFETWRRLRSWPRPLSGVLRTLIGVLPDRALDMLGAIRGPQEFAHRVRRLAEITDARDLDAMHDVLATTWQGHGRLATFAPPESAADVPDRLPPQSRMMLRDFRSYLVDDILTKVDRASMGVSLEVRVPMLDHRVVEMAWGLPLDSKIGPMGGKRILRDILSRHVPRELFERPKMGFSIPLAPWLRGPLREWAESILFADHLEQVGLDPIRVRRVWSGFLGGDTASKHGVWSLLMLGGWLASRDSRGSRAV